MLETAAVGILAIADEVGIRLAFVLEAIRFKVLRYYAKSSKKLKIYSVLSKQIDKEIRNTGKGNKY